MTNSNLVRCLGYPQIPGCWQGHHQDYLLLYYFGFPRCWIWNLDVSLWILLYAFQGSYLHLLRTDSHRSLVGNWVAGAWKTSKELLPGFLNVFEQHILVCNTLELYMVVTLLFLKSHGNCVDLFVLKKTTGQMSKAHTNVMRKERRNRSCRMCWAKSSWDFSSRFCPRPRCSLRFQ